MSILYAEKGDYLFHKEEGKTKKEAKLAVIFLVMLFTPAPMMAQAFNPGAHLLIGEGCFPNIYRKIDFRYGCVASDLANRADEIK